MDAPTTLAQAWALSRDDHGLAVVSTLRANQTIQASLVNTGVITHPGTGAEVLAFVTYGKVKLANLRARPQVSTTFRNGWSWATVEGTAELAGPDDPGMPPDRVRLRDLHRGRRHPRRLERIRPRDGRAAAYRGPHHRDPNLRQLKGEANGSSHGSPLWRPL